MQGLVQAGVDIQCIASIVPVCPARILLGIGYGEQEGLFQESCQ